MKVKVLQYKGYYSRPWFDERDNIYYGTILGISDLVDFYSKSEDKIEEEFHKAVDEYLEFCDRIDKIPSKAKSKQQFD